MLVIGSHLSVSKGYKKMTETAVGMNANTFQFFTRNPRGTSAKALDHDDIEAMRKILAESEFGKIVAHAPYILNLGSEKPDTWEIGVRVLKEDLLRMQDIPSEFMVLHPGNHLGRGPEYGIDRIAEGLNLVIEGNENTQILLETMSGKGTEVGKTFGEIKSIIDKVDKSEKLAVCLDTCHVYSAGYDIVNDLDGVLDEFDSIIGLERLKVIHLNDTMTEFNSRKDRHAIIGEGNMGFEAIMKVVSHPKLKDKVFILETPNEVPGHSEEIAMIRTALGE